MTHTRVIMMLASCLLLALSAPALAQDKESALSQGEISRLRTEISNEIYSPFCPGKTLVMCTSPNAAAVRRDIQDLAREGKDKETIKNEIVARYGEEFRLVEPPAEDNAALGIVIVIGFLIAAALIVFFSRRSRTTVVASGSATDSSNDDDDDLSEDERDYLDELRAHVQS